MKSMTSRSSLVKHLCSRGEFSLIDRRNLTFNHCVDAETSLEEIRSERFKDGGV